VTMKHLTAKTLHGLLGTYETAIAELRAMRDPTVDGLIDRMARHRDEVLAALAAIQSSPTA
jgi:RNase P/RNase MRP subunit POP5